MSNIYQQISELQNDLNAHRQGWVTWPAEVLREKTRLLVDLLKQM